LKEADNDRLLNLVVKVIASSFMQIERGEAAKQPTTRPDLNLWIRKGDERIILGGCL
jgi:hypothetical protein